MGTNSKWIQKINWKKKKTPRQKLKESLDRNSKEWNELPEWVRKAINTDLIFNVRKPNE